MQRPSPHPETGENPIIALLRQAWGADSWVPLDTFVEAALYAPGIGYYHQCRTRVGHAPDRDFYTASSLGPLFARLVVEASTRLLGEVPRAYTFVELGAEPERSLLDSLPSHPFAQSRVIRVGEPVQIEGDCVVFSNELFDAQPFRRFVRMPDQWCEIGLNLRTLRLQPASEPDSHPLPEELPASAPSGYQLDFPSGARVLAEQIVAQPWKGLFLAFDYGLPWSTLTSERPEGTARTYRSHRLGSDLLETPGLCDITHHICWDLLSEVLTAHRFGPISLDWQETFFMRYALPVIAGCIETEAGGLSQDRQTLKTLLHPENMGRKFQALHALRC